MTEVWDKSAVKRARSKEAGDGGAVGRRSYAPNRVHFGRVGSNTAAIYSMSWIDYFLFGKTALTWFKLQLSLLDSLEEVAQVFIVFFYSPILLGRRATRTATSTLRLCPVGAFL